MAHDLLAETVSILDKLVSFPTMPFNSNRKLVEWIEDYLRTKRLPYTIKLDADGEKATLLATIGPTVDGGVILSGHTDVVDVRDQNWQTPPFELTARDGRLYARGACDMKGFIACALAQAPAFAAADLRRPIHIALSRDEEIGSLGMDDMLALIEENKLKPAAAIVGEPTTMNIVAGHKAGIEARTIFTGAAAHSSLPTNGESATVPAARFAVFLADLSDDMAKAPVAGSLFDPPHAVINVGVIKGGTAMNIVAEHCEVHWLYRPLPHEDATLVIDKIKQYAEGNLLTAMRAGGHPVNVETVIDANFPGLTPDENSPALKLAQALLGDEKFSVAPFGADSGHFQASGIPAVLIGPGNIQQAHKADEFIETAELERCLSFLDELRDNLRAS